jgi:hypothetical protein
MLHSCPCTLNCSELHCTNLSYNSSSLYSYRLRMDHTEKTRLVTAKHFWGVTSLRMRKLHGHKENTATLLYDVNVYTEVCLPSRCLGTSCITPLFYCCVRALLSNGCFRGSTFLAWSKYATIYFVWLSWLAIISPFLNPCSWWRKGKKKGKNYPCSRPWRPIGLWDVEAPTFSIQSAHRWRWVCQPYAPVAFYLQEDSWYSFLLEAEPTPGP